MLSITIKFQIRHNTKLDKAAVLSRGKFLLKVGNMHFLVEKYILFKKKDVSIFFHDVLTS